MYAIEEGVKKVNDVEVETFQREVLDGHACLEVEAGTTGYKGGCSRSAGARTFLRIDCVTGDFFFGPITDEEKRNVGIVIAACGDDGLNAIMKALDFCRDALNDADWETVKNACFDRMYAKSVQLGGLVSGEHGIGYAKKEFLRRQYGQTPITLMQGIKQVFDPKNILNPGKVCF
jgi:hypothetical protein